MALVGRTPKGEGGGGVLNRIFNTLSSQDIVGWGPEVDVRGRFCSKFKLERYILKLKMVRI